MAPGDCPSVFFSFHFCPLPSLMVLLKLMANSSVIALLCLLLNCRANDGMQRTRVSIVRWPKVYGQAWMWCNVPNVGKAWRQENMLCVCFCESRLSHLRQTEALATKPHQELASAKIVLRFCWRCHSIDHRVWCVHAAFFRWLYLGSSCLSFFFLILLWKARRYADKLG